MEKPCKSMETAKGKANYNVLGALLEFATRQIQNIFLARYETLTKEKWGRKSFSGYQFFRERPENERLKTYANAGYDDQKKLEGDAREWDIAMLHLVLFNIDFSSQNSALKDEHDEENRHITSIKDVRNKYVYPTQKQIRQVDFQVLWEKAKTALVALGSLASEIEEIRAPKTVTSFKLFDPPTKDFTGRAELLRKIHNQMLQCSANENCLGRIVVLCGPGGIGKSELARMYATTYIQDPIIQNVAWIDAQDEKSMKASFVNLAKTLQIPPENRELEEIIKDVYDHFSNHIKTGLFIFDNSQQMNDGPFGIHKYLPIQESLKRRPLVLLTTRDKARDIPNEVKVIDINALYQEESIQLLEKTFCLAKEHENYGDYKEHVAKLADALQGYPLGLALASSYIKSNRNWAGLNAGIEAYLKIIEKPCGDDQLDPAAKYQVIFKNVLEVTLQKIKAQRRLGRNALNIMAYFPPDQIQKDQIQSIFKACYFTTLNSKAFRILEKYSLIKMDTLQGLDNTKMTRLIRIQPLVQDSIREKLDQENDISYLLCLCDYFSYKGYNEAYPEKEPLMRLHEFLKDRKWPENSIHFSLIFVSIMTRSLHLDEAFHLSTDIYTFLNMEEREKGKISNVDNDVANLFSLCMFWINQSEGGNKMRGKFKVKEDQLQSLFISTVQPATEFLLTSPEGPKSLEEHSYLLCIELLQYLIRCGSGNESSHVIPLTIQTLNQTPCSSTKYISKLYDTLWLCLKSQVPESLTLLGPLLQKHFQIYTSVFRGPYYSNVQFYDYWLETSPLDLRFIYEQLENTQNHRITHGKEAQFGGTNAFLDAFIEAGGHLILQQHIAYLTLYKVLLGDTHLLLVLRSLALYCSTRDTLIGSPVFLSVLADFTELILEEQHLPLHKFTCIMTWFSLFATQKPTINNFYSRTCAASIYSVASVLHGLLNQLKNLQDQDYLNFDYFDNEAVIRTFLETHKDVPESLAFRTASRISTNAIKAELHSSGNTLDTALDEIEMLRLKEKLQLLQQTHEQSWRLLCILAYLPNDPGKAKIKDIFWFIFREDVKTDAFRTIDAFKDELLRPTCLIKGRRRWKDADLIQIFDLLKLCVRNELLIQNDPACLLGVCNFEMCSLFKDGSNRKGHLSTLHEYLHVFKWPQNSTHISMAFSVLLTPQPRYLNSSPVSIKLLEDVYEFSKSGEGEGTWYETPHFKLFQLCLFSVTLKLNGMDVRHEMWEDPNLNPDLLTNTFLAMIKPSIEHLLNPETNLPLIQSCLLRTSMYILKSVPRQMDNVESELRKKILSTILDFVNATSGCQTKSTSDLFGFLYNLAKHESVSHSVDYIVTIFRKHLGIYTPAFVSSAEANLQLYWDHAGPLRLVVQVSKNGSAEDKSVISNCFIANDGPKILVDYLLYRNTSYEPTECTTDTDLFRFIQVIAYECNYAERLIQSPRFLDKFSQFTSQSLLFHNNDFKRVLLCLSSWFALFARCSPETTKKQGHFFFRPLAPHLEDLEALFCSMRVRDFIPQISRPALETMEILEKCLETFSKDFDLIASQSPDILGIILGHFIICW